MGAVNVDRFTLEINAYFGTISVPDFAAESLDERSDRPPFESDRGWFTEYGGKSSTLFGVH